MCDVLLRAVVLSLGLPSAPQEGSRPGPPPLEVRPQMAFLARSLVSPMLPVQGPHFEKAALEGRQHSCLL